MNMSKRRCKLVGTWLRSLDFEERAEGELETRCEKMTLENWLGRKPALVELSKDQRESAVKSRATG